MTKKILAVVLFATMLLSLAAVANAADPIPAEQKATAVAFVALTNSDPAQVATAAITPPGSTIGVLAPGLSDDTITITGLSGSIANKNYKIAIVLNGLLDLERDAVSINNYYYDFDGDDKDNVSVSSDGRYTIVYATYSFDKISDYNMDRSNSRGYDVHIVKDGAVKFDYSFTVKYVDKSFTEDALLGVVDSNYTTLLGDFNLSIATPVVPADEDTASEPSSDGIDYSEANAIVTASRLNVRASASASSSILLTLNNGDGVYVKATVGNWSLIVDDAGNEFGYVFTKYIKAI